MRRTASEERWAIDWPAQQAARALARSSLDSKNYSKALSELAKVIDILMAGLLQYRKQVQRQSKWGKPVTPTPNRTSPTSDSASSSPISPTTPVPAPPNSAPTPAPPAPERRSEERGA